MWTCSVGPITSLPVVFISSGGHRARFTENEHLSRYELSLREISYDLHARALICAL